MTTDNKPAAQEAKGIVVQSMEVPGVCGCPCACGRCGHGDPRKLAPCAACRALGETATPSTPPAAISPAPEPAAQEAKGELKRCGNCYGTGSLDDVFESMCWACGGVGFAPSTPPAAPEPAGAPAERDAALSRAEQAEKDELKGSRSEAAHALNVWAWRGRVGEAVATLLPFVTHSDGCAAVRVIGRFGSRSGLRWTPGDDAKCDCGIKKAIAATECDPGENPLQARVRELEAQIADFERSVMGVADKWSPSPKAFVDAVEALDWMDETLETLLSALA